jgi:hypothetical protein
MAKKQMNYQQASAGSGRGISAGQWNGFLQMHRDYYNGGASNGPLPPILNNSIIASAVLADDMEAIAPFQPVRIVKQINFVNINTAMPSYVVEPVDAVDENGDPTDRHGNYGFTLGEGCTPEKGGRIVVAGIALVALTRDQCVDGTAVANNYLGSPFDGYDGKYESSYYLIPDGTLSDDDKTVLGPVGHFKVMSWYVPDDVKKQAEELDSRVYLAIDMSRRFTTASVELFATISGYSGAFDDQTYNQGYAYLERPLEGVPATIADANPRVVNNNGEPNTPAIKNGEANYFRCLVTNPHLYDISQGTHVVAYSESYNRLIVTGDPLHNDGRINAWMYSFDPDELCSRGRSSGFYIANGYGDYQDDNTDSCPYPTYLYTSEDRFSEGTVMLAADYMTKGGSSGPEFYNQGVPSQLADDLAPAIVLMMDANHEYATYCSEKCPEEGVLMSADFGEYRIIDKKPLHNNSASGTYPQWNRCLGFLKNESQMSGVVEVGAVNLTAHDATKHNVEPTVTSEGLKEIVTATVKTDVIGLTRANHVDKMSQPQYQGSLTYKVRQSLANTSSITIDTTTLYKYARDTTLRVWGVESDGTETQIDSCTWDINPAALYDTATSSFETLYNVNFFWEEKYKFIYFDIETDGTAFNDTSGTITLHRRTNFGGDSAFGNGQVTLPADLTLPAWPTYPNGDIESAGIFYNYTR